VTPQQLFRSRASDQHRTRQPRVIGADGVLLLYPRSPLLADGSAVGADPLESLEEELANLPAERREATEEASESAAQTAQMIDASVRAT
jgi:hypothetical protein